MVNSRTVAERQGMQSTHIPPVWLQILKKFPISEGLSVTTPHSLGQLDVALALTSELREPTPCFQCHL